MHANIYNTLFMLRTLINLKRSCFYVATFFKLVSYSGKILSYPSCFLICIQTSWRCFIDNAAFSFSLQLTTKSSLLYVYHVCVRVKRVVTDWLNIFKLTGLTNLLTRLLIIFFIVFVYYILFPLNKFEVFSRLSILNVYISDENMFAIFI